MHLLYAFLCFSFTETPVLEAQRLPMKPLVFFIVFQITMPECHKFYPNCIWPVPTEWHTLGFYSALPTKVYWNYATHIVRVCVTPISPKTSKLDITDKSNLQVHFGSNAMASLYDLLDLLCYHSLTSTDPLLEQLLSLHVSTLISSIISPTNTLQMMNQFIQLTLQFLHFIPMIQPTSLKFFYIVLILYATPRFLPQGQVQNDTKRPQTENDRRPAPALGRLFDLPEAPSRS